MDVDFSQVGQNVALQSGVAAPVSRPSTPQEQETAAANQTRETGKVVEQAADKKEGLNGDAAQIESAVAEISEFLQAQNRQLAFSVDEGSQRSVVKVTDSESGEVIRQIPSEEVLELSKRIRDLQSDVGAAVGVLFNKQV
ncbi:flagellar protein FlaG [Aestuariibacter halophilus]|uniref:Flagellar protein FlaG n=1 Tax=Fluctibacter halophilus TaxID=226011 RepID=A0ABS8G3N8_9ALTE|nr:flagellar protein FlaG [Aestuariibacter halophilus]MCC2615098.1 flagellar protein FlaG [Aestuariibacter halophilus]